MASSSCWVRVPVIVVLLVFFLVPWSSAQALSLQEIQSQNGQGRVMCECTTDECRTNYQLECGPARSCKAVLKQQGGNLRMQMSSSWPLLAVDEGTPEHRRRQRSRIEYSCFNRQLPLVLPVRLGGEYYCSDKNFCASNFTFQDRSYNTEQRRRSKISEVLWNATAQGWPPGSIFPGPGSIGQDLIEAPTATGRHGTTDCTSK
eukprot:scpid43108/ scgid25328/ 